MDFLELNFKNLCSLKIPSGEKEIGLLKNQNGITPEDNSFSRIEHLTWSRLALLFEIFKNLPNGATIIDIGAGNSLVDLALMSLFPEKDFKFTLVDGDGYDIHNPKIVAHHYNENGYVIYNNWSFVTKAIELNNLPLENFNFVHPDNFTACNADVVLSFSSWGWHYPLSTYLDIVDAGLKKNGYLSIMPLINADNAINTLSDRFGPSIESRTIKFVESDYSPAEAKLILDQIELGKLHRDRFALIGIWQKTN